MESDADGAPRTTSPGVLALSEAYAALDQRRVDLDQRLISLPKGDEQRDTLWQELEAVLAQRSALIAQLAATPSTQSPDMRAKASVLARLLRSAGQDGTPLDGDAAQLALSLADEVARLI